MYIKITSRGGTRGNEINLFTFMCVSPSPVTAVLRLRAGIFGPDSFRELIPSSVVRFASRCPESRDAGRESRREAKKSGDRRFINEAFRNKARAVLLSSRVKRTARRPRRYQANLSNGSARVPLREEGVFEEHERDVGTRYVRCSLALSALSLTLFLCSRASLLLSFSTANDSVHFSRP